MIGGHAIVVDVERGRTQRVWIPRRLGGGAGPGRVPLPSRAQLLAAAARRGTPSTMPRFDASRQHERWRVPGRGPNSRAHTLPRRGLELDLDPFSADAMHDVDERDDERDDDGVRLAMWSDDDATARAHSRRVTYRLDRSDAILLEDSPVEVPPTAVVPTSSAAPTRFFQRERIDLRSYVVADADAAAAVRADSLKPRAPLQHQRQRSPSRSRSRSPSSASSRSSSSLSHPSSPSSSSSRSTSRSRSRSPSRVPRASPSPTSHRRPRSRSPSPRDAKRSRTHTADERRHHRRAREHDSRSDHAIEDHHRAPQSDRDRR